jgi:hypothetical protein
MEWKLEGIVKWVIGICFGLFVLYLLARTVLFEKEP